MWRGLCMPTRSSSLKRTPLRPQVAFAAEPEVDYVAVRADIAALIKSSESSEEPYGPILVRECALPRRCDGARASVAVVTSRGRCAFLPRDRRAL